MNTTEETTHDFGAGAVPAHRHKNGGGWVADTAFVDETACVESDARVYGNARVEKPSDVICISGLQFHVTVTPKQVTIGCQTKSIRGWRKITKLQAEQMGLTKNYAATKAILLAAFRMVGK